MSSSSSSSSLSSYHHLSSFYQAAAPTNPDQSLFESVKTELAALGPRQRRLTASGRPVRAPGAVLRSSSSRTVATTNPTAILAALHVAPIPGAQGPTTHDDLLDMLLLEAFDGFGKAEGRAVGEEDEKNEEEKRRGRSLMRSMRGRVTRNGAVDGEGMLELVLEDSRARKRTSSGQVGSTRKLVAKL
ncbi:hypothetical protein HKX48_002147 [Thoreauomyces humboldtii]|nr:hypothetical protein HKX48_002147 [Thoreauomyces humboldtii]